MKTVVGLFDTMEHAKKAALNLENAGIPYNDISVVANNEGGQYAVNTDVTPGEIAGQAIERDAIVGAEVGGVAGLLIGLTALAIPGVGWAAGAGWFWAMVTGAVVGAIAGGLVGALTNVGVTPEDAATYAEGVRRGGMLVVVRAQDEMADRVARILDDDGAINIDERAEQYRREGFTPAGTPAATTSTTATSAGTPAAATAATTTPSAPQPVTAATPMGAGSYPTATPGGAYNEHLGRGMGYGAFTGDFRNDYQTRYANTGRAYEQYEPAYRYGFDSANDPRYRGHEWNVVEHDLQRDWDTRRPGTWFVFVESIRYAWDRTTGAERGGIQTGGHATDGTPDTRGITEKVADTVTGDRIDYKTGKVVR